MSILLKDTFSSGTNGQDIADAGRSPDIGSWSVVDTEGDNGYSQLVVNTAGNTGELYMGWKGRFYYTTASTGKSPSSIKADFSDVHLNTITLILDTTVIPQPDGIHYGTNEGSEFSTLPSGYHVTIKSANVFNPNHSATLWHGAEKLDTVVFDISANGTNVELKWNNVSKQIELWADVSNVATLILSHSIIDMPYPEIGSMTGIVMVVYPEATSYIDNVEITEDVLYYKYSGSVSDAVQGVFLQFTVDADNTSTGAYTYQITDSVSGNGYKFLQTATQLTLIKLATNTSIDLPLSIGSVYRFEVDDISSAQRNVIALYKDGVLLLTQSQDMIDIPGNTQNISVDVPTNSSISNFSYGVIPPIVSKWALYSDANRIYVLRDSGATCDVYSTANNQFLFTFTISGSSPDWWSYGLTGDATYLYMTYGYWDDVNQTDVNRLLKFSKSSLQNGTITPVDSFDIVPGTIAVDDTYIYGLGGSTGTDIEIYRYNKTTGAYVDTNIVYSGLSLHDANNPYGDPYPIDLYGNDIAVDGTNIYIAMYNHNFNYELGGPPATSMYIKGFDYIYVANKATFAIVDTILQEPHNIPIPDADWWGWSNSCIAVDDTKIYAGVQSYCFNNHLGVNGEYFYNGIQSYNKTTRAFIENLVIENGEEFIYTHCGDHFGFLRGMSISNNTLYATPNIGYDFLVLPQGAQEGTPFNNTTAYVVDGTVTYNCGLYICIQNSTGNLPTDVNYWELLTDIPLYDSNTSYTPGDVLMGIDGIIYVVTQTTTNNTPPNGTYYSSGTITDWHTQNGGGGDSGDTTPPTFAGLVSANDNPHKITLSWNAATDAVTPQNAIVYNIYVATSPNGFNYTTPSFTTSAGVTTYNMNNVVPGTYWIVVRAKDAANNIDTNTNIVEVTVYDLYKCMDRFG